MAFDLRSNSRGLQVVARYRVALLCVVPVAVGLGALGHALGTGQIGAVKPTAAFGLALLGVALPAVASGAHRLEWVARIVAGLVAAMALATLAQDLVGHSLGVDDWLLTPTMGSASSRMAPATALCLACCGFAAAAAPARRRTLQRIAEGLAAVASVPGFIALLGYSLRVRPLYQLEHSSSMAFPTAVGILCLSVAILVLRRDGSLAKSLADPGAGGSMVRRFLPVCALVLALAGAVGRIGPLLAGYNAELGLPLFLVLSCLVLIAFVWHSARELNILEQCNVQTTAALAREQEAAVSEVRFRAITDSAQDAIVSADCAGEIVTWNAAAARIFGYEEGEALGMNLTRLMPDRFHEAHLAGLARFSRTGTRRVIGKTVELAGRRRDGTEFPCELSLSVWDRDGQQFLTAFLRDISARVQSLAALAQSEQKFRTLVQSAPVAIFETNVDGECLFINKRWSEVTGMTVEEARGSGWSRALHPDDRARVSAEWNASVLEDRDFTAEYRFLTARGVAWVVGNSVPLRDSAGKPIGHLGTLTDITERKLAADRNAASLAEKEVLLREVHHRVKNNLQVISSLLRLQATKIQDPTAREVFLDSQSRVHSIALLHDSLYQSPDLARVDMAEYLEKLVSGVRRTYSSAASRVQIDLSVANVWLPVDKAVPCGLIINELLTNAFKHAFPPGRDQMGHLSVRMVGSNLLSLTVTDDGVGLPSDREKRESKSLGMTLIHTLAKQLNARVDFQSKSGTRCELEFPLELAQEVA